MSEISDLFAKDPLQLTRADRNQIVQKYREDRERYMTYRKPSPEQVALAKAEAKTLTIDKLELDL